MLERDAALATVRELEAVGMPTDPIAAVTWLQRLIDKCNKCDKVEAEAEALRATLVELQEECYSNLCATIEEAAAYRDIGDKIAALLARLAPPTTQETT